MIKLKIFSGNLKKLAMLYSEEASMIKTELIPLNYDLAFTSIFNKEENIIILENFISTYLEIPLKEIKGNLKLLNRNLKKRK